MADISNTGQPSTQNYFIGRGSVYLAELANGAPQPWRFVGSVADLNIEADTSVIEHFTATTFARTKDAEVISQLSLNFNLTFDEWMYENLSEFFLGSTSTYDQTGGATVTPTGASGTPGAGSQFVFPGGGSGLQDKRVAGKYYDLYLNDDDDLILCGSGEGLSHEQRVYKIDPSYLRISGNTEGNGWSYDANTGQIYIEPGGSVDTDIQSALTSNPTAARHYLSLGYFNSTAGDVALPSFSASEMSAITSDQKTLAVKFIALNGNVQGEKHEIVLHQAKIRPQGSLGLINEDEFGQITLEGSLERNTKVDPDGGGYVTIRKIS